MLTGLPIREVHAPPATFETLTTEPDNPDDAAGFARFNIRTIEGNPTQARKYAIAVLAAPFCDGKSAPEWPLDTSRATTTDDAQVIRVAKMLDLDREQYSQLVRDAMELVATREFERLRTAVAYGLERHGRLDERALEQIKSIVEGKPMGHKTVNRDPVSRDKNGREIWDWRKAWPPAELVDWSGEAERKMVDELARKLEPPTIATFEA